ncbi:unnamed protein product, partial [Prorocentrum cordatum]
RVRAAGAAPAGRRGTRRGAGGPQEDRRPAAAADRLPDRPAQAGAAAAEDHARGACPRCSTRGSERPTRSPGSSRSSGRYRGRRGPRPTRRSSAAVEPVAGPVAPHPGGGV